MNVKITEGSVTFQISQGDLQHLLSGVAIEKKVMIGHSDFVMVIDPDPEAFFEDCKQAPLKLILGRDESCLMLCTTVDDIEKLSHMPDHAGLKAHVAGLDVFLQIHD
jgi:hypothetical protein